jgi:hypothetical protein
LTKSDPAPMATGSRPDSFMGGTGIWADISHLLGAGERS